MVNLDDVTRQLSKLPPSSMVIVEVTTPAGQKVKFRSVFIGFLSNKYVLLQMPDLNKNRKLAIFLNSKTKCTVRGLSEGIEGAVIAFNSVIQSQLKTPSPMMVLQIPAKVELQSLRKVSRIETEIAVDLQLDKYLYSGTMLDLSAFGCLVSIIKSQDINVDQTNKVNLIVTDSKYNGVEEIKGTVCNVKQQAQTVELGIAFDDCARSCATRMLNQVMLI